MFEKIFAAPLQGYTETAWRNAHHNAFGGIDAYYTPFVRLEKGEIRNKDRRETQPESDTTGCFVPQILASEPEDFRRLTDYLVALGYREIDINWGCPFPPVALKGKGSGILPHPDKIEALVNEMRNYAEIRFTAKMRLGGQSANEWQQLLPILNDSPLQHITLHPRIGKQQYKGNVDLDMFQQFYDECRLPLVYNGDLCTLEDIHQLHVRFPKLKGIMLGRGLLANPALALEYRNGQAMDNRELLNRTADMLRQIRDQYSKTIEGGDAQLLQKLKTAWKYLLPDLDKKLRKAILKAPTLTAYDSAVATALR